MLRCGASRCGTSASTSAHVSVHRSRAPSAIRRGSERRNSSAACGSRWAICARPRARSCCTREISVPPCRPTKARNSADALMAQAQSAASMARTSSYSPMRSSSSPNSTSMARGRYAFFTETTPYASPETALTNQDQIASTKALGAAVAIFPTEYSSDRIRAELRRDPPRDGQSSPCVVLDCASRSLRSSSSWRASQAPSSLGACSGRALLISTKIVDQLHQQAQPRRLLHHHARQRVKLVHQHDHLAVER